MSSEAYLKLTIQVGSVVILPSAKLSSPDPHPFVVIGVEEGEVHMVCGSSQQDTVNRLLKRPGYTNESFVWVSPDGAGNGNSLNKDTFFDCNKIIPFPLYALCDKHFEGSLLNVGILSESDFDQIITGVDLSPLAAFPVDMMVYGTGFK